MDRIKWPGRPATIIQCFEENEYISSCGNPDSYNFICDVGETEKKKYAVKDSTGKVVTLSNQYLDGSNFWYEKCGTTHTLSLNEYAGLYKDYHLDDTSTTADDMISAIIWTGDGDVHCATSVEANKS